MDSPRQTPDLHVMGAGEEASRLFLEAYELKIPPIAQGEPLSVEELRWCLREIVRTDVLLSFAPLRNSDIGPLKGKSAGFYERCLSKTAQEIWDREAALGPLRRFGIIVVKEALGEARVSNPDLVFRSFRPPGNNADGFVHEITVREAQGILAYIGFGPVIEDGIIGPVTLSALKNFQDTVGIPVNGALDYRTGALLRNATLNVCAMPVLYPLPGRPQAASGGGRP
ncbi:MAG: peptidoglycan-binding protein [Deltaproteobacteria bacterium]|nr:peptidoglycan-binding protein [Deltaproteobacteria bacterium]